MPEPRRTVAAVVLAAGSSTRMGRNKLLLPLDGETLVRRAARAALAAADRVVVVLGHDEARVRAELDGLTLQERDPVTGEQRNRVVVEVSPDGAEQLYAFVVQMAEQAAYLTKKALLLREGVTPALVLHAAAEQLEDTMIRSGDSEREFKRLARSYRDEIWPGVFGEIDAANARVASVARARDALVATLSEDKA